MEINIDYKMTDSDFEKIANIVIQKQSDAVFMKKVLEVSEKVAEKQYWHYFQGKHAEFEITELLHKHLKQLVKENIKENNLLQIEVQKVLNINELRVLGSKRLREIAYQLEREAEEFEN